MTKPSPVTVQQAPLTPNNLTAPASNGSPAETPKKVRQKPEEIVVLKRIAALLETQDAAARMRICRYLSEFYLSLDAARMKAVDAAKE